VGVWLFRLAVTASIAGGPIATTQSDQTSQIGAEYARLLSRAREYNAANPEMNRWMMNSEHCFLVGSGEDIRDPDLLISRVIAFVRRPGALDLIFGRLLDKEVSDDEVLADAEMLVFAGEDYERAGEILPESKRAKEILDAAEHNKFSSAENHFPQSPIRQKIENAARRALDPDWLEKTPTSTEPAN
jgi:hypothetical protein